MAGRPKRPGPTNPRDHSGRVRRRSLASGSPPPPVVLGGEVHPGGDPVTWDQLALFVVAYGLHPVPDPAPDPAPEPAEDPGEQLPLPGMPPATPADHLAAMRAGLARQPEKKKRSA